MKGVCAKTCQGSTCVLSAWVSTGTPHHSKSKFKKSSLQKGEGHADIFNHSIMYTENITLYLISIYTYMLLHNFTHHMSYNCV